ncbi:non-homologous end-joining DNA ligase [Mycobacterium avium]|uniref:non-homologous end-joining DNA ligase n=1 Tax=Mycobacterium avium TaxID=1764 RepID=UPI001CC7F056|nr:non-homologous end-joining DNA ligase [Mycobacterium avium]MBZ4526692.1 ATP-dependent DNA ligase [Mycobacterium avium subsp. hominissuis]MBZ4546073.1 ATP-dependent DNA ligase [Mycobacterium avium subsp. hominissuis]MBZ4557865.1 ATP-dependent DNA ligase [Mycobacterium avium subsp. hominissuis]MBZ4567643.1 ATP-dependent DNA ligase [Mycobacterium avium subsp. hominissuis]MBZ4587023.1 ATP-dependent DNA ligase [Mycobacterium avium subsp. hominissuis]
MLASAAAPPTDTAGYCFEAKWDGIRLLARCAQRVELFSRHTTNLTARFPEIVDALSTTLQGRPAILDGELVAFDHNARPSFELIQRRLRTSRPGADLLASVPLTFCVFDLIYLDGNDLTGQTYLQRRRLLNDLRLHRPPIVISPYWTGITPDAMAEIMRGLGLEGYVLKRATSTYQPGRRSPSWIKYVVRQRNPMVIAGFIPSTSGPRGGLAALLVGAYDTGGQLRYCGQVSTGLSQRERATLVERGAELEQPAAPFAPPIPAARGARWVHPNLVVDIEYRQFSGRLRHPVLKAVLPEADSRAVRLPTLD